MEVYGYLLLVLFYFNFQTQFAHAEDDDDYVMNFDSALYLCADERSANYFDTSKIETSRFNETSTWMSGVIGLTEGISINTLLEVYVEKEVAGRYDLVMSLEICNLCEEIHKEDSVYHKYMKHIDFPNTCPIPPGEYALNHFRPYAHFLPLNKATAGRYQVTLNFYSTPDNCIGLKTFMGCLKADLIIEPK